jgi:glycosyltransferase involved in cell wall biosynthesis
LLKWWIPDYYNRCAHVIVPSAVAEASLREFGVRSPITVVPTAVPLPDPSLIDAEASRAARAQWDIPDACPLLLYVGRIAQEKNIELVLESFGDCSQRLPDARLLVVGGGPHLDALRRRAQGMACRDRVVFAGPMAHDELAPVYAAADLFVFASTTETQGLVMAEARAAGTPCVLVRGGGASETIADGEDGIIVEPERGAFSSAVLGLLDDPTRLAEMGRACLRRATRYAPEAMTDAVLGVYRSVTHQPSDGRPKDG